MPMTKFTPVRVALLTALCLSPLALTACSGVESEAKYPTGADRAATDGDIYAEAPSIFGPDGLSILGGRDDNEDGSGATGIGVNSYLWRAALDTVSFMPLASADPFGGVILTDWYSPEGITNERLKANVFIMGRKLRSDGIRVRLFKQERSRGEWVDVNASSDSVRQLEDAVLTRARQLRVADLED